MSSKNRDVKAARFLCIILSVIVVFVAAVCIFISARNKKIEAGEIDTAAQSEVQTSAEAGNEKGKAPETEAKKDEKGTSEAQTTEAEKPETTEGKTTEPETEKSEPTTKKPKSSASIFNPQKITPREDKWYLTLINSNYVLPESYSPDLVYVCGSEEQLDKKVAPHYEKMYEAAKEDGVNLTPCSGYRSYDLQKRNYTNKTNYYESLGYSHEEALVQAATIIMPPGSSEHNLGYAMDIVCVDTWFEDTAEFKWLNENAADYGFILRYPADKTDITKVTYEPWHWRYVGVEDAKAIKASGQVLEEYLGEN